MPEKEPSPWLTVQSKKEKFLSKKQDKKPEKEKKETKPASSTESKAKTIATGSTNKKADNREELDFMFDEEINKSSSQHRLDSDSESDSDDEYDEMDDQDISKLVIITQTPPVNRKVSVHDKERTGVAFSRSKITSELAKAINDGLYYYEQDLNSKSTLTVKSSLLDKQVDLVSQEEFSKLKGSDKDAVSSDKSKQQPAAAKIPEKAVTEKKVGFGPSSLPADNGVATPSFKQLLTHVNAIKNSQATSKQATAAVGSKQRNRRDSFSHMQSNDKLIKSFSKKTNERYSGKGFLLPYFILVLVSIKDKSCKTAVKHSPNLFLLIKILIRTSSFK